MLTQHFKTHHSCHIDRMGDITCLFWRSLVTAFCRDYRGILGQLPYRCYKIYQSCQDDISNNF